MKPQTPSLLYMATTARTWTPTQVQDALNEHAARILEKQAADLKDACPDHSEAEWFWPECPCVWADHLISEAELYRVP